MPAEETISLRATWVLISQAFLPFDFVNMATLSADPYWPPSKGLHLDDLTSICIGPALKFLYDIAVIA